jgi:hypothetical protein
MLLQLLPWVLDLASGGVYDLLTMALVRRRLLVFDILFGDFVFILWGTHHASPYVSLFGGDSVMHNQEITHTSISISIGVWRLHGGINTARHSSSSVRRDWGNGHNEAAC